MRSGLLAGLAVVLAWAGLAATDAARAQADTPACAQTTDPNTPPSATPGDPCWTDVTPYPFGYDGNPVDPSSPYCASVPNTVPDPCYLVVDSLAFRAWNRGLATVSPGSEDPSSTTPYGVWRYNGSRWYPDPTFPGQTACPGDKIIWAGKLDAWVVGPGGVPGQEAPTGAGWPALCRLDGTSDQWEPLRVPQATIAHAGPAGSITSGACFAWDNCWFFGTGGAVVHWDGQVLSDVSVGLGPSPWLRSSFTSAVATTDAVGNPLGFAVAANDPNDTQPDGSSPPQLFSSSGGAFAPVAFAPPPGQNGVSPATDLDAISFDAEGDGWIAGNPAAGPGSPPTSAYAPFGGTASGPSPLLPISSGGAAQSCPGTPANTFTYTPSSRATSYLWSSIGALPGGSAVAGGVVGAKQRFGAQTEPVLAQVSCASAPQVTRFRIADPSGSGALVAADASGYVTAVAASAVNDVSAATTGGADSAGIWEPPHLYLLTDGQPPQAPAGDDQESRPVVFVAEPTIFQFAPPVVVPPPPAVTNVVNRTKSKVRKIKLKPAVYDVGRPKVARASGGTFTLSLTFKVRRKVRIGLEAIRHGKVVSSSGLRTFTGRQGTLSLVLTRQAWPTGLKFILPKAK